MKPADAELSRLEYHLGRLLVAGVIASAALLTAGLGLWLAHRADGAGMWLMKAGLVVLMATPIARVLVSFVEYVRIRDWLFVATTIVVLVELTVTVAFALINR